MRDYAKISPKFWAGSETGRALRRQGPEAMLVAIYLMSSPHSNMLGLFLQPLMYLAYETGLTMEGASKGLQCCIEAGFCSYDEASEVVWVHEMALWQIGAELKAADKRCKGVQREYDALPKNPFLGAFFERYARVFHLKRARGLPDSAGSPDTAETRPNEAPSKPLRSQEQEQEQEQEHVCVACARSIEAPVDGQAQTATHTVSKNQKPEPLPDDWTLPEAWKTSTLSAYPGVTSAMIDNEAAVFAARKRETKVCRADWHAEWLVWCGLSLAFKRAAQGGDAPSKGHQGVDVSRATVPGRPGKDPVLLERERHQGAPMPADVRAKLNALRGGVAA